MSDERKHIDELFKSRLVGHQAKAPENAWQRLNTDMHGKKKAVPLWYLRAAAAAVLLLLAFAAGYYLAVYNVADRQQLATEEPFQEIREEMNTSAENPDTGKNSQTFTDADHEIRSKPEQQQILTDNTEGRITGITAQPEPDHTGNQIAEGRTEPSRDVPGKTENINDQQQEIATPAGDDLAKEKMPVIDHETDPVMPTQEEVPPMDPQMLQKLLYNEEALAEDILNHSQKNNSKWSVGAQMSPVYSYRSIDGNGLQIPNESVGNDYFEDVESGIVSIAGGISLNYRFSDRLSLGSGLYVSRIGQENNDVLAYNDPGGNGMYKLATSAGTVTINPRKFETVITEQQISVKDSIPGDYIVNASMVQNLDYLEVPLILKYKVLNKKLSFNLMGGLSPGILVNNRSYFNVDGGKVQTGTTENINPVIYNTLIGVGLEYAISKKLSINMEPTFKYSLSPVNTGSELRYQPYSISWFTGLSYKLY